MSSFDEIEVISRHPLLDAWAASGCRRLLMGIESGSDRVLRDIVREEVTREEVFDVAADIGACGRCRSSRTDRHI